MCSPTPRLRAWGMVGRPVPSLGNQSLPACSARFLMFGLVASRMPQIARDSVPKRLRIGMAGWDSRAFLVR